MNFNSDRSLTADSCWSSCRRCRYQRRCSSRTLRNNWCLVMPACGSCAPPRNIRKKTAQTSMMTAAFGSSRRQGRSPSRCCAWAALESGQVLRAEWGADDCDRQKPARCAVWSSRRNASEDHLRRHVNIRLYSPYSVLWKRSSPDEK